MQKYCFLEIASIKKINPDRVKKRSPRKGPVIRLAGVAQINKHDKFNKYLSLKNLII